MCQKQENTRVFWMFSLHWTETTKTLINLHYFAMHISSFSLQRLVLKCVWVFDGPLVEDSLHLCSVHMWWTGSAVIDVCFRLIWETHSSTYSLLVKTRWILMFIGGQIRVTWGETNVLEDCKMKWEFKELQGTARCRCLLVYGLEKE